MALLNWTDYPRFWLSALPPASAHYDMVILANDDDKLYRSDGSAWVPYSPQISYGLVPPTAYLNEGVALVSEASSLNVVGTNLELTAAGNALTLTAEGPQILNAGNPLVSTPTSIDFTGTGVVASAAGTAITVTVSGNPIQLLDEGSLLTSNLTSLNFVGAGITATAAGGTGTITVPSIPPALAVSDEGTLRTASASSLNFVGGAVSATAVGSAVTVTINDTTTFGSTPPPIAATGSAGVASSVSRSDHTHEGVLSVNGANGAVTLTIPLPSSVVPAPIAATGAAGSSADYSRRDHTHEGVLSVNGSKGAVTVTVPVASNAVPSSLGAAAAGTSADLSRSDHVHDHGNQAGGTLHSTATTSTNGFMSAADKVKADAYTPSALTVAASAPGSPTSGDLWVDTSAAIDAWTYVYLTSDQTTNLTTPTGITGMNFTPAVNGIYVFEAQLILRTTATGTGPRPGVAWSTGLDDGIASLTQNLNTTSADLTYGTSAADFAGQNGGFTSTTVSQMAKMEGTVVAGTSPSGTTGLTIQSETGGTTVSVRKGSWFRWKKVN